MATETLKTVHQYVDRYSRPAMAATLVTDRLAHSLRGLGAGGGMGGLGAAAGVGGFAALVAYTMDTAANIESIKMGMASVLGSTQAMEGAWARVRELAKLPGLGLEEAARGMMRLVSAGMTLKGAEETMRQFGNAIARAGGNREEFEGILRALSQIAAKGRVSAEEINQMAERMPEVRDAMKAVFGTADTEMLDKMGITAEIWIPKMVEYLSKLPRVLGGAKNEMANLADNMKIAAADFGTQLNRVVLPVLVKINAWMAKALDAGRFAQWGNVVVKVFQQAWAWAKIFVAVLAGIAAASFIVNILKLGVAIWNIAKAISAAAIAMGIFQAISTKGLAAVLGVAALIAGVLVGKAVFNQIGKMEKSVTDALNSVGTGLTDPATGGAAPPGQNPEDWWKNPTALNIERNTRKTAEYAKMGYDLRKYALGGGDLGAMGVTPTEFYRGRGKGNGSVTVEVRRGMGLDMTFSDLVQQAVMKMKMNGTI